MEQVQSNHQSINI